MIFHKKRLEKVFLMVLIWGFLFQFSTNLRAQITEEMCTNMVLEADRAARSDKFTEARNLYHLARQHCPEYYLPDFGLGIMYLSQQFYPLSELYLQEALAKLEENINDAIYQTVLEAVADAKTGQDKYAEAIPIYYRLLEQQEYDNAFVLSKLGWIMYKENRLDEGIRLAQKGLEIKPDASEFYNILACIASRKEEFQKAISLYKKVQDADVRNNNLGETYRSMFDFENAKQHFLQSLHYSEIEDSAIVYFNIIDVFTMEYSLKQAEDLLLSYIEESMSQGKGLNDLGMIFLLLGKVYYLKGEFEKSLSYLEKAEDFPQYFSYMGLTDTNYKNLIYLYLHLVYQSLSNQRYFGRVDFFEKVGAFFQSQWDQILSWWYGWRATDLMVSELPFEENFTVYRTEGNLEYTLLIPLFDYMDADAVHELIDKTRNRDTRNHAQFYYDYYQYGLKILTGDHQIEDLNKLVSIIPKLSSREALISLLIMKLICQSNLSDDAVLSEYKNQFYTINPLFFTGSGVKLDVNLIYDENDSVISNSIPAFKEILESFPLNCHIKGFSNLDNAIYITRCSEGDLKGIELSFFCAAQQRISQKICRISANFPQKEADIYELSLDFCKKVFHIH